jgi:TorA maturation chaperone TorD
MPPAGRLRRLGGLLALPGTDALEVLADAAELEPWLADSLPELAEVGLEEWQGEYTRLFISGYPKTLCPPFESAYRQGSMGGSAAGDLEQLYRRAGLQSNDMPADFLGTMLECAAYLLEQEAAPDEEVWSDLWDKHLTRWVPRFAKDLTEHSHLGLYRALGRELGAIHLYTRVT